jgi:hypothetical protein
VSGASYKMVVCVESAHRNIWTGPAEPAELVTHEAGIVVTLWAKARVALGPRCAASGIWSHLKRARCVEHVIDLSKSSSGKGLAKVHAYCAGSVQVAALRDK